MARCVGAFQKKKSFGILMTWVSVALVYLLLRYRPSIL